MAETSSNANVSHGLVPGRLKVSLRLSMLLVSAKIILSDRIVKMNISLILIGIILIFQTSRKIDFLCFCKSRIERQLSRQSKTISGIPVIEYTDEL